MHKVLLLFITLKILNNRFSNVKNKKGKKLYFVNIFFSCFELCIGSEPCSCLCSIEMLFFREADLCSCLDSVRKARTSALKKKEGKIEKNNKKKSYRIFVYQGVSQHQTVVTEQL